MSSLTKPQKRLLLAMFAAGPNLVHHVHAMDGKLPVMIALKRAGLVVQTVQDHASLWKGRLTAEGRALSRELAKPAPTGGESI